ncbi:MAG: hypothetical protein ACFFED_04245 [Candidatus Thorarchaeota archaeon]
MSDKREMLVQLIMERDISSIQIMASDLLIDEDTIRDLLKELVEEGRLQGYITEDGRRFFRKDIPIHPSKKPKQEDVPEFMKYNSTPGMFLAVIGITMMIMAGVLLALFPRIIYYENVGVSLLLIGVVVALSGCYYIGRRKTPM